MEPARQPFQPRLTNAVRHAVFRVSDGERLRTYPDPDRARTVARLLSRREGQTYEVRLTTAQ